MKALVLDEYNHFIYTDYDVPEIKANEVLIKVKACGICGSDVHGMDGSTGRREPPVIMGHEASGVIESVGKDVSGWQTGDRVTFDSTIYCGECRYCRHGDINLCDNRRVLGVSCDEYRQNGAFAEYVSVPHHILYTLPDTVSYSEGAMAEAISIALHAINRVRTTISDSVVVFGLGIIGLLIIKLLKINGVKKIIAVDIDEDKLNFAKSLGVDLTLNSEDTDIYKKIQKITMDRGADCAFEAVGIEPTINLAISSVRKGGSVAVVGNISPSVGIPLQKLVTREISVFGSCASKGEYEVAIDLLASKRLSVDNLISAAPPLSEGYSWFKRLYEKEKGLLKVVLVP